MMIYDENKAHYDEISKDKFQLVQSETIIHDAKMQTKPIGFFKDVLLRFSKNKASVFAAAVILIIVFFAICGPAMNEYTFNEQLQTG